MKRSYKQEQQTRKHFVLLENRDVLGVFSTLKKVCEFMDGKKFPSYWTLVRKDFDKFDFGSYSLQVIKNK